MTRPFDLSVTAAATTSWYKGSEFYPHRCRLPLTSRLEFFCEFILIHFSLEPSQS